MAKEEGVTNSATNVGCIVFEIQKCVNKAGGVNLLLCLKVSSNESITGPLYALCYNGYFIGAIPEHNSNYCTQLI